MICEAASLLEVGCSKNLSGTYSPSSLKSSVFPPEKIHGQLLTSLSSTFASMLHVYCSRLNKEDRWRGLEVLATPAKKKEMGQFFIFLLVVHAQTFCLVSKTGIQKPTSLYSCNCSRKTYSPPVSYIKMNKCSERRRSYICLHLYF